VGAGTGRILQIHYWENGDEAERNNALGTVLCDITEALEGEGYALSAYSYDPDSVSADSNYYDSASTRGR
jgi:hypothetical protein